MAILSQFTRPARFDNRRKPRYFWPPHQKFWRKILPEAIKSKGDGNSGANRAIIWGGVVSAASHHITFAFSRRKCFDWEIQLVMGGGLLFHSRALVFLFITMLALFEREMKCKTAPKWTFISLFKGLLISRVKGHSDEIGGSPLMRKI